MLANPADALKQISQQLQQKFNDAGMGKVEEFTDMMEELMWKLQEGPDKAFDVVQDLFKEITGSLDKSMQDPSSLAPTGGGLAACGVWYGNSVVGKLSLIKDDVDMLMKGLVTLATDVKTPIMKLAAGLKGAIAELEQSIKGLAKLPKLVAAQLEGKDSPDDIAKIDTSEINEALKVGDLDGPMGKIAAIKDVLKTVIDVLSGGAGKLEDFITSAPEKFRTAFDVPQPLCFLQSIVMDAAPQAMKDLLELCKKLEGVSFEPILKVFNGAKDTVEGISIDAIKTPVNKFLSEAKDLVGKLDKTVSAAKMAGGGGGALAGLKKMF